MPRRKSEEAPKKVAVPSTDDPKAVTGCKLPIRRVGSAPATGISAAAFAMSAGPGGAAFAAAHRNEPTRPAEEWRKLFTEFLNRPIK